MLGGNTIYASALFIPLVIVVLMTTHDGSSNTAEQQNADLGQTRPISLSMLCMAPRLPTEGLLDLGRYVVGTNASVAHY